VAGSRAERRVADTLAADLRAAGHGTVPVVTGGARTGDIVNGIEPGRTSLGAEGYELRAGARLSVTGATGTGAFYGTRTPLQLLARGDPIPGGYTADVPRYRERGVGVRACVVGAWADGGWSRVAAAGTVGASRSLRLAAPGRARRWRVRVTAARSAVRIAEFGLYRSRT
jgi:hypothetical protein